MKKSKLLFVLLISLMIMFSSYSVVLAEYPERTIEIIVPYGAGGGTDRFARTLVPHLEEELGVNIAIINREGAAGEVGMTATANAKPDGYTLGFVSYPVNVMMEHYKNTDYSNDEFHELAAFTMSHQTIMTAPDAPFDTIEEFVDYARERPGEVTVAESGDGHLALIALLEEAADIKLTPVNYPGGGDNLNALLGGHVDASALALLFSQTARDQGAKILAVAHDERVEGYPNVPTFKELGYDFVYNYESRMLVAPSGVDKEVINTLNEALLKLKNKEELIQNVQDMGSVWNPRMGDELDNWLEETNEIIIDLVEENEERFRR